MQGVMYVTGELGAGKGIYLMHQLNQYYSAGRKVATNFDVNPEYLDNKSNNPIIRIPDRPRPEDLKLLGRGCPDDEKSAFGALILDEAGTWLNCRDYRDKNRKYYLDWFIHARKLGWDVYVAVQNESMIDNQISAATGENVTFCSRMDKFRIPLISDLMEMFFPKRFGRMAKNRKTLLPHLVNAKTYFGGYSTKKKPDETLVINPKTYFHCYDTNHIFTEQEEYREDGTSYDARACYTILSGKTLYEWYQRDVKAKASFVGQILTLTISLIVLFCLFTFSPLFGSESEPVPVQSSSTTSSSSVVVHPDFPVDVSDVYITGSIGYRSSEFQELEYDYVLESPRGVFYPEDIGLRVVSVNRCVARIIDSETGASKTVRCQPFYTRPTPVEEREDLPDVAKASSNTAASFLSL